MARESGSYREGYFATIAALYIFLDFPLSAENSRCEDKLINPEKYQSPDKVCDHGRPYL